MPPISIDGVLGEIVLFELLWGCFLFLWLWLSFYLFWLGFLCDVFGLTWERGFDCEAGKGAGFDFIFEEEWFWGLADKIIDDSCLSLDLGLLRVEHSWLWLFPILRTHVLVNLFERFKDVLTLLDDFDLSDNHLFLFCKIIINRWSRIKVTFCGTNIKEKETNRYNYHYFLSSLLLSYSAVLMTTSKYLLTCSFWVWKWPTTILITGTPLNSPGVENPSFIFAILVLTALVSSWLTDPFLSKIKKVMTPYCLVYNLNRSGLEEIIEMRC